MPSYTVLDQICWDVLQPRRIKERAREKQSEDVRGLFYENRGDGRASEKRERARQTQRGGVADGDMLIYEPQGFSLTILSFTETERGGEKDREREEDRRTDNEMQNWLSGERCGYGGRAEEFRGAMLQILWYHAYFCKLLLFYTLFFPTSLNLLHIPAPSQLHAPACCSSSFGFL